MTFELRAVAQSLLRRLKRVTKERVGLLLVWLRPDVARRIESRGIDLQAHYETQTLTERLVIAGLIARNSNERSIERIAREHARFWASNKALAVHSSAEGLFEKEFLKFHLPVVEALERILANGKYHTLCEIGCGQGQVITYLAKRFPTIETFIGLDLNEAQIEINKSRFNERKLRFVAADATAWVPQHAEGGTIFLTNGGVLEYFPEQTLEALLREVARRPASCFAIVEPIDGSYDLVHEDRSRLFGGEMSFSHNYPRLFEKAGFRICWQQEAGQRWLMLIAAAGGRQ